MSNQVAVGWVAVAIGLFLVVSILGRIARLTRCFFSVGHGRFLRNANQIGADRLFFCVRGRRHRLFKRRPRFAPPTIYGFIGVGDPWPIGKSSEHRTSNQRVRPVPLELVRRRPPIGRRGAVRRHRTRPIAGAGARATWTIRTSVYFRFYGRPLSGQRDKREVRRNKTAAMTQESPRSRLSCDCQTLISGLFVDKPTFGRRLLLSITRSRAPGPTSRHAGQLLKFNGSGAADAISPDLYAHPNYRGPLRFCRLATYLILVKAVAFV